MIKGSLMRYRTIEVRDVRPAPDHPAGTRYAEGTVECLDANPASTGPNRIPVARYNGPLISVAGGDWQPLGCRGDHPERWEDR